MTKRKMELNNSDLQILLDLTNGKKLEADEKSGLYGASFYDWEDQDMSSLDVSQVLGLEKMGFIQKRKGAKRQYWELTEKGDKQVEMAIADQERLTIGLALSGGGFRATLHALGVLLYVVDARINSSVTSIVSVSGGSIANAFVGQYGDFTKVEPDEFRSTTSRLVRFIVNQGLLPSPPFYFYIGTLLSVGLFLLVSLLFVRNSVWPAWQWWWAVWILLAVLLASLLLLRGTLLIAILRKKLFTIPSRGSTRLGDLGDRVDHTFCSTDLNLGTPFYFTSVGGGMVYSEALGWGMFSKGPGQIGLDAVVRASAAFPGAFPPKRVSRKQLDFWSDPMFRLRASAQKGGRSCRTCLTG